MTANRIFLCAAMLLAACGGGDDGTLDVAFIDTHENLQTTGLRLSPGAQHVQAAISAGLVKFDERGDVIPDLADRWIVTDDGKSFIFRLRDGTWADGSPLTAESVRAALSRTISALRGTSLGLDLAPIEEIRAMAGRVVEIRLSSAEPSMLQLLAQPELVLDSDEGESGPMSIERGEEVDILSLKDPVLRGLPEEEDWQEFARTIVLRPATGSIAVEAFDDGTADMVLGGRIGTLPLVDTGPLSRGTVRIDPAIGLFGLLVLSDSGALADGGIREGLAMALDRPALVAEFNVGGWSPTTRVVAPGLPADPGLIEERWNDTDIDELRARAGGRIAAWRSRQSDLVAGEPLVLKVAMGSEPGLIRLFAELSRQFRTIGIELERVDSASEADLQLIDNVARYAGPRWFLNQFNCGLRRGLCSEEADYLVGQALDEDDPERRASLLAEAEAEMTLANVFIPFGAPLRWSLVRGNVTGFSPNEWAFHPLPDLATIPR